MPELKTATISKRAERALARATKDRHAWLATGVVAGAGVALAATKAALDRIDQDGDDGQPRAYRPSGTTRASPRSSGICGRGRFRTSSRPRWASFGCSLLRVRHGTV